MSKKRICIDGQETRKRIGEMAGKVNGVRKICMERGLAKETINQIIRKGYGSAETIDRCIKAGIPIKISDRPIPCRARKEHSRNNTKRDIEKLKKILKEPILVTVEEPRQMRIEDLTGTEQIKEILINGLTAIIEELKKI